MTQPGFAQVPGYPVEFDVEPQLTDRNRLTTGFRLILGIPQFIIVGGFNSYGASALTGAASVMAFISWFAVLFRGEEPRGLWDFITFYMRWWVRVAAYAALLRDDYPPFGDEPYPTTYGVTYPAGREEPSGGGSPPDLRDPPPRCPHLREHRLDGDDDHRLVRDPLHRCLPGGPLPVRRGGHALERPRPVLPAPAARRVPALQPGGVTARRTSVIRLHPAPAAPSAARETGRPGRPLCSCFCRRADGSGIRAGRCRVEGGNGPAPVANEENAMKAFVLCSCRPVVTVVRRGRWRRCKPHLDHAVSGDTDGRLVAPVGGAVWSAPAVVPQESATPRRATAD